jgi:hypothetical protein
LRQVLLGEAHLRIFKLARLWLPLLLVTEADPLFRLVALVQILQNRTASYGLWDPANIGVYRGRLAEVVKGSTACGP